MNDAFRIQLQSGPETGRVYDLTDASMTIGRYPLADIVIDDPEVAYRHAVLTRGDSTYRIADLTSDAGTYVNGRRVGAEPVALAPGDVILLGSRVSAAFLAAEAPISPADDEVIPPLVEQPIREIPAADAARMESEDQLTTPAGDNADAATTDPETQPEIVARPASHPLTYPEPLPPMPIPPPKNNGRILLIAAGCLVLLLACCCSATLFMYYIGGDWLLNQMGLLP